MRRWRCVRSAMYLRSAMPRHAYTNRPLTMVSNIAAASPSRVGVIGVMKRRRPKGSATAADSSETIDSRLHRSNSNPQLMSAQWHGPADRHDAVAVPGFAVTGLQCLNGRGRTVRLNRFNEGRTTSPAKGTMTTQPSAADLESGEHLACAR